MHLIIMGPVCLIGLVMAVAPRRVIHFNERGLAREVTDRELWQTRLVGLGMAGMAMRVGLWSVPSVSPMFKGLASMVMIVPIVLLLVWHGRDAVALVRRSCAIEGTSDDARRVRRNLRLRALVYPVAIAIVCFLAWHGAGDWLR